MQHINSALSFFCSAFFSPAEPTRGRDKHTSNARHKRKRRRNPASRDIIKPAALNKATFNEQEQHRSANLNPLQSHRGPAFALVACLGFIYTHAGVSVQFIFMYI